MYKLSLVAFIFIVHSIYFKVVLCIYCFWRQKVAPSEEQRIHNNEFGSRPTTPSPQGAAAGRCPGLAAGRRRVCMYECM